MVLEQYVRRTVLLQIVSGVSQLALSTRVASGVMPKYLWCLPDEELASVLS